MDFEEFRRNSLYSFQKCLIDQVEEQSHMCDVTVKVDNWEKKFHRCVLVQSPFFECVFRHEYKETQTGKIEINLGTPASVNMAIMFLYGKMPKLTMDNAESMMALAEYFFIPNLKSACVAWLRKVEVNERTCMKLIEIASLFDINLHKCMEFAKGCLDILFGKKEFTRIDSDSVKYIFTERDLSYISMDDKLNFLVKWTKVDPIIRLGSAKGLVNLLDFSDNSREMLKQVVNDPIFREITEDKVTAESSAEDCIHEVLITVTGNLNGKSLWCLDLTRNKWFKLETSIFTLDSNVDILGVQNPESTVYFLNVSNVEKKIVCFNLETLVFTTFPVVQTQSNGFDTPVKRIDEVTMYANVCIIKNNMRVAIKKKIKVRLSRRQMRRGLNGELRCEERVTMEQINTSTVHIGKVVTDRIETKPLFTFLNGNLSKMCINNISAVAFTDDQRKRIIVYDINDCKMEIIDEPTTYNDKICCAEKGFVIFNNTRCIYLLRQEGNALDTKYQKKIVEFSSSGHTSLSQLYFFNSRWYRYFNEGTYRFEWTTHEEILTAEDKMNVHWTPLPLPIEASRCRSETLNKKMFHIRIQKSKLRCYIECPHCDRQNNKKTLSESLFLYQSNIRNYHYDYEDYSYDDYSDNDDYFNDWYD